MSISIGFYFRGHYFILLLPALSLLAGIAVSRGLYVMKNERTLELIPAVTGLALFIIGLGSEVITNSSYWFEFSPVKTCQQIYGSSLFPEAVRIADYIRTNTPPQATIAVIGSEPEIYFYARRHSATGYIYMYPLMEHHEYALRMQEEMIREIETARPEYVVFVKMGQSWLGRASSHQRLFEWWSAYQAANYDTVRTVDIATEKFDNGEAALADSGNLFSDKLDKNAKPAEPDSAKSGLVLVFKRKPTLQKQSADTRPNQF